MKSDLGLRVQSVDQANRQAGNMQGGHVYAGVGWAGTGGGGVKLHSVWRRDDAGGIDTHSYCSGHMLMRVTGL